jgi:hypothetical protein
MANTSATKGATMRQRNLTKLSLAGAAFAVLLGLVTTASGGLPPVEVTVFDAGGKVAFKGRTSSHATFATRNLQPGNYVVQFNAKSAAVKGNYYLLVVSGGKKKVLATDVPGETLIGGGAAMKIDVGPGSQITGQIAKEQAMADQGVSKSRVIDGKRYVWVTAELGSNIQGRWVEEGLAPARNIITWGTLELRKMQDRAFEGSMIPYHDQH